MEEVEDEGKEQPTTHTFKSCTFLPAQYANRSSDWHEWGQRQVAFRK
jgi:hypothetical protein